jgi:hypothetical protein
MEKEKALAHVEEENIRNCPGETDAKGGKYTERKWTENIFKKITTVKNRISNKERTNTNMDRKQTEKFLKENVQFKKFHRNKKGDESDRMVAENYQIRLYIFTKFRDKTN